MKPCRHTISCFLAVLCLFLTRSCDNGLDDLLELQRIMIPVSNEAELQAAITKNGAVIGIIKNFPLTAQIPINTGNTVTITAFNREVTLKSPAGVYLCYVNTGTLILGDKRSTGKLVLEGNTSGNAQLIYMDSSSAKCIMKDGVILQNNTVTGDGGGIKMTQGNFIMEGGIIRNNTAQNSGGGVSVSNNGTFFMKGGTICDNTETSGGGGGVSVSDGGKFFMSGGTIYKNTTTNTTSAGGGGVYISGTANGEFTMSGGTIRNNTAYNNGGGICVTGTGILNIMGNALITYNESKRHGGGVYINNLSPRNHSMEGNASITNNTANNDGGGLYISIGFFYMNGGKITGNSAGTQGGGVYRVALGNFNTGFNGVYSNSAPAYPNIGL